VVLAKMATAELCLAPTSAAPYFLLLPDPLVSEVLKLLRAVDLAMLAATCRGFRRMAEETAEGELAERHRTTGVNARVPAVPGPGEGWCQLLHQLECIDAPLCFARLHPYLTIAEGGGSALKSGPGAGYDTCCTGAVMRAGVHCAVFTLVRYNGDIIVGICSADFDPTGAACATSTNSGWGFGASNGHLYHGDVSGGVPWEGTRYGPSGAAVSGDKIGFVLDCDEGSLTMFLNSVRLGVLAHFEPGTRLRWISELYFGGDCVRISSSTQAGILRESNKSSYFAGGTGLANHSGSAWIQPVLE
jgi:hypothetical protein